MTDSAILTHCNEGLSTATLNRPEKANALNLQMLRALADTLYDATAATTATACNLAYEAVVVMKRLCRDGEP